MLRHLELRRVTSRVTKTSTKAEMTAKQVGHLPGCKTAKKSSAAHRLTHLERVRFVDPDVATRLQIERCIPKRLEARAAHERGPTVKLLRRRDQRKRRTSQLSRAALRVRDEERRH